MDIALGDSGRTLTLPAHWQELDTVPEDAPGTVAFGYRTQASFAAVTLAPLDGQMMPVDRDEVVRGIGPALQEAQAELVEVDAGETPSGDLLVYTVVRTPEPEEGEGAGEGDQLNLTLHVAVENGDYMAPFMVQGFFTGDVDEALDQARDLVSRTITAE
ncbi:hypothetical protein [Corynebacterium sp.]|jgi:hypothetical protein|uniref:hypothetical protein n=1 Tax=Corynebacterium sp. TaxID=1720 RepID=UPI0025C5616B|nr:hypothetical protein [Corynebacterium sp.]